MKLRALHGRSFDTRDLVTGSRDIMVNAALAAVWPAPMPSAAAESGVQPMSGTRSSAS
jgi:hypothetical protein